MGAWVNPFGKNLAEESWCSTLVAWVKCAGLECRMLHGWHACRRAIMAQRWTADEMSWGRLECMLLWLNWSDVGAIALKALECYWSCGALICRLGTPVWNLLELGLLCWHSSGEQRCSIGGLASTALKALLHASFVADVDWLGFELNYVLKEPP